MLETAVGKSTRAQAFAATLAYASCFALMSAVMLYLSPDPRSWGHYPAVAFADYAVAVVVFQSLGIRRVFRDARDGRRQWQSRAGHVSAIVHSALQA